MAQPRKLVTGIKEIEKEGVMECLTGKLSLQGESVEVVSVLIRSVKGNKAVVFIGPEKAEETIEGYYGLEPGESVEFDYVDLNQIFVSGKKADEVEWIGIAP